MQLNLYLTFDDGPSQIYTPRLLDLLKRHGIRASFFVVGASAEQHPQIIRRMRDEGHYIGLHSLRHTSAYLMAPWHVKKDFLHSLNILKGLGIEPKGYRPPWGHCTPWTKAWVDKLELELMLWDVMAEDWKQKTTANEIAAKLLERVSSEAVICLHDGRCGKAPERMISALEVVLPQWIAQGYQFKRMDE